MPQEKTAFAARCRTHIARVGLGALVGILISGCLGMGNESDQFVQEEPHSREKWAPPEVDSIPGVHLATTGEIQAFLGRQDFKIVLTGSAWYTQNTNGGIEYVTSAIYLLTPAEPGSAPRIHRITKGDEGYSGAVVAYSMIRFSPDGGSIAYSAEGILPVGWIQSARDGIGWRIPFGSQSNGGEGVLGEIPFWIFENGKSYQCFSYPTDITYEPRGNEQNLVQLQWSLSSHVNQAQVLDDSTFGQVSGRGFIPSGDFVNTTIFDVSRDKRWILSDRGIRAYRDSVGSGFRSFNGIGVWNMHQFTISPPHYSPPSFNPLDPTRTSHTDCFMLSGPYNTAVVRTISGDTIPIRGKGDLWAWDNELNGVWRYPALEGSDGWVDGHWTNLPEFCVAASGNDYFLIRMADSPDSLYANLGTRLLQGKSHMQLIKLDAEANSHYVSLWARP